MILPSRKKEQNNLASILPWEARLLGRNSVSFSCIRICIRGFSEKTKDLARTASWYRHQKSRQRKPPRARGSGGRGEQPFWEVFRNLCSAAGSWKDCVSVGSSLPSLLHVPPLPVQDPSLAPGGLTVAGFPSGTCLPYRNRPMGERCPRKDFL